MSVFVKFRTCNLEPVASFNFSSMTKITHQWFAQVLVFAAAT